MPKLLILTALLVVVYQFDDLVKAGVYVIGRLRKQKFKDLVLNSDRYVGTVMGIIGLPLLLNYIVVSGGGFKQSLWMLFMVLFGFWVVATGLGIFLRRLRHARFYDGATAVVGVGYAVAGLIQPTLRVVPWHSGRDRKILAKLAFLLSLPVAMGLVFKSLYEPDLYQTELFKYVDVLIMVMIGGLFMHFTIGVLRKFLHRSNMPILGYFRIALGLGVSFLVISKVL